jgi:hypothetical protein
MTKTCETPGETGINGHETGAVDDRRDEQPFGCGGAIRSCALDSAASERDSFGFVAQQARFAARLELLQRS